MRDAVPRRTSFPMVLVFLAALSAPAASAAVIWNKVFTGFSNPVEIAQARDGSQRLFVVEQAGKIRIIKGGTVLATPFIDLGPAGLDVIVSGGERGLLGIAFHRQYATNRQFYVNYTRKSDGATVIARYRASAGNLDVADPASGTILLTIAQPEANHNGGALKFGPDGYLYIGMGDGGGGNDQHGTIGNGQNTTALLGKILRIDVDNGGANPYAIPPGNPYASGVGGMREIFALGVRNPWRMSFDRITGDFWFGDVGQGAVEEVDMLPAGTGAGTNFGWRIMEGTSCTGLASPPIPCNAASLTLPVVEYTHALGCSVTGGYVYRGTAVPTLIGQYLYGDYCTGRIWAAQRLGAGPWTSTPLGETGYAISTFGEDEAGELYFANYASGDIYQFADSAANTPLLVVPAGPLAFGNVALGGSSAAQVFTITNGGGGTLSVTSLTPGGLNPAEFSRTGTCAGGSMLAAAQSCTVSYVFTPAQLGGRSADLTIATNAGNRTMSLTGTGIAAFDIVDVIEYYHAGLDHYFITPLPAEITVLDAGQFGGWSRTHESFKAWSTPHIETRPVCRYYMPPDVGNSHFFSASPTECAVAPVLFPSFVLESLELMHEALPDLASGTCPANMTPIYRVWNKRPDSNHRYLTSRAMRDAMVARGYVAEGYGPDAVVMCGP